MKIHWHDSSSLDCQGSFWKNCSTKFKMLSILWIGVSPLEFWFCHSSVAVRTLLHIQERLKVEHSLQDLLFKSAIKGPPLSQPQRYSVLPWGGSTYSLKVKNISILCASRFRFLIGTTVLPPWTPAGYMVTCMSTRWQEISTLPLASMCL